MGIRCDVVGLMAGAMGLSVLGMAGTSAGQMVTAGLSTPSIDRWMYVFNQNPGNETEARVFSSLFAPYPPHSFDNRDGQFLVAWDTGSLVPTGQPLDHYRIVSATVTARVSADKRFVQDDTYDSYTSYQSPTSPDADPGHPLEMFVCGYRNGYTAQAFTQTSPFNAGAPFPFPAYGIRNVFPAQYDSNGALLDVSNNVDQQFEARPISIGHATANSDQPTPVDPGTGAVNVNADEVFPVDLSRKEAVDAIRAGLAGGRVEFLITSLTITTQQNPTEPRFYTRAWNTQGVPDPAAKPASLSLTVCVGRPADWNCSGTVEVQDIFDMLNDWFAGRGDFNADGVQSVGDIFDFLNAWFAN
jgi:hypothetical protein